MKIKSVRLRDFKRFTDLTINEIPESARLVILAGPNGVGKSSLFEAFIVYLTRTKNGAAFDPTYHLKPDPAAGTEGRPPLPTDWSTLLRSIQIQFYGVELPDPVQLTDEKYRKAFYIRSSYRVEPDFQTVVVQGSGDILDDGRRPPTLISLDSRVSDNYQRIVAVAVEDLFVNASRANETLVQAKDRLVGEARDSLERVLPGLRLEGPGNPFDQGTFLFTKGNSELWRYKNLSGGEKAAFDLVLDFVVKKEKFDDTVFCIDEPESHMNTSVQGALLREILSKLPPNCQLWVATHSIGIMRTAKEIAESDPGSVAFLDFGRKNFEAPVIMRPEEPTREFWKRQFEVAIGDLAELLALERIVFCEGDRQGRKNPKFDARCYRKIFGAEFPSTEFISVGGTTQVEKNSALVGSVLDELFSGVKRMHLFDRDDRSQSEIEDVEKTGGKVLTRRDLESYLYDDEILRALCLSSGQPEKTADILQLKSEIITSATARGIPPDDIKSVCGEIYNKVKRLLSLTQCGNDANSFAVDTLSPLITQDTNTYLQLRSDIFST